MLGDEVDAFDGAEELWREHGLAAVAHVVVDDAVAGPQHPRVAVRSIVRVLPEELAERVPDLDTVALAPGVVLLSAALVRVRSAHEQQARKNTEENLAHPRRHGVCCRSAEVDVQHDDGGDNRESDEYHREEKVLADEWHHQRRRWDDLGQQKEEDSER